MVTLPDNILTQANLTEKELRTEIALLFYAQKRLSSGQARELAGLNIYEFQQLLTDRGLFVNYDVEDLEADLKTIQSLHKTRQSAAH